MENNEKINIDDIKLNLQRQMINDNNRELQELSDFKNVLVKSLILEQNRMHRRIHEIPLKKENG